MLNTSIFPSTIQREKQKRGTCALQIDCSPFFGRWQSSHHTWRCARVAPFVEVVGSLLSASATGVEALCEPPAYRGYWLSSDLFRPNRFGPTLLYHIRPDLFWLELFRPDLFRPVIPVVILTCLGQHRFGPIWPQQLTIQYVNKIYFCLDGRRQQCSPLKATPSQGHGLCPPLGVQMFRSSGFRFLRVQGLGFEGLGFRFYRFKF